jgi:pimeloyl-ACP methyl ester carboxylesterase
MKPVNNKVKIIWGVVIILVILSLGEFVWFSLKSPGTPRPVLDEKGNQMPGSISEILKWNIGSVDQYLIVRGYSKKNPIVLFLHGGPGSPEFPLYYNTCRKSEQYATVVHWEQRGTGKSYLDTPFHSTITTEQLVKDTIEVSEKLRKKFNKKKIFLMGHSWGSFLGVLVAQKRPDLFYAYIGIGQVVYLKESEKLAYQWVLSEAKKDNNSEAVEELTEIGEPPYTMKNFQNKRVELKWVSYYGGAMSHKGDNFLETIIGPVIDTREYTVMDKINYIRGSFLSLDLLWDSLMDINLLKSAKNFALPVFILQGKYDYQVSTPLAKKYYNVIKAPEKRYYQFEHSAHGTIFEEPERYISILKNDILPLAYKP